MAPVTTLKNPKDGALELLVVQATPFCNLDCSYCYLPNRSSTARMTEATLERLFESVFSSQFASDQLTVLWHAGEPLVAGIDYYCRAFALIERLNRRHVHVTHRIQTNGTLIDQNWVDFFLQHDVKVGISLDGPPRLHDRHRQTRRKGGTFERVMQSVHSMQENGCPFHAITVLTRDSLSSAHELFRFYLDNKISQVAFNLEEVQGVHLRSSLQGEEVAEKVKAFFRAFFGLVEAHPGQLNVREFAAIFDTIAELHSSTRCNPQTEPMHIVTVGVNGELSTFSPELIGFRSDRYATFAFSNVHAGGLPGMVANPAFARVREDIQRGVERCRQSCDYFELCLGGSPSNKMFENGSFDTADTLFCRLTKKALIDVALESLECSAGIVA
jgi:uncharacterized protein